MFFWHFLTALTAPRKENSKLEQIIAALKDYSKPYWSTDTVEELLNDAEIDFLGSGAHGIAIDNGDTVIKIFDASDESYMAFADIARAYPNPHFPLIYGDGIIINDVVNYIILEKLEPVPFCDDGIIFEEYDESLYAFRRCMNGHAKEVMANPNLKEAGRILFETTTGMMRLPKSIYLTEDLHSDNAMLRGETIVITDPWC